MDGCRPDSILVAGDMLTSQMPANYTPALETMKLWPENTRFIMLTATMNTA